MTAGFFGAAQDGIKRHDDGKVLHSTAESGTERQKAAHNAAQVHCLPQHSSCLFWLFCTAQDGIKRHHDGKMRHITRHKCIACLSYHFSRLWHMTAGFFGAAQDGIERHDDGKVLHNAAESGTQRQKAAHDAAQVHGSGT